jgi:hypothetical protein
VFFAHRLQFVNACAVAPGHPQPGARTNRSCRRRCSRHPMAAREQRHLSADFAFAGSSILFDTCAEERAQKGDARAVRNAWCRALIAWNSIVAKIALMPGCTPRLVMPPCQLDIHGLIKTMRERSIVRISARCGCVAKLGTSYVPMCKRDSGRRRPWKQSSAPFQSLF